MKEIFEEIVEVIPPELMKDRKFQIKKNHSEQKRKGKRNS